MQFRTAGFGGFHKQDVIGYIESSVRKQEEKTAALTAQLEQLREELRGKEQALAEAEAHIQSLEEQMQERDARLEQACQAETKVSALEEELARLHAQVEQLTPPANAYEQLKERTAGVELEAHRRAGTIELDAQEKARKTKQETAQWAAKVQAQYRALRAELDGLLSNVSGDLTRVQEKLQALSGVMSAEDANIKNILCAYHEPSEQKKAHRPLTHRERM